MSNKVYAVITDGERILSLSHPNNYGANNWNDADRDLFSLPGGSKKEKEDTLGACTKELSEEIGPHALNHLVGSLINISVANDCLNAGDYIADIVTFTLNQEDFNEVVQLTNSHVHQVKLICDDLSESARSLEVYSSRILRQSSNLSSWTSHIEDEKDDTPNYYIKAENFITEYNYGTKSKEIKKDLAFLKYENGTHGNVIFFPEVRGVHKLSMSEFIKQCEKRTNDLKMNYDPHDLFTNKGNADILNTPSIDKKGSDDSLRQKFTDLVTDQLKEMASKSRGVER